MTDGTGFLEDVALAEFLRRYLPLLASSGKLRPFEYRQIRTSYALIMMERKDSFTAGEIDKSIRVGAAILRSGALVDFEQVIKIILVNMEATQEHLNRSWEAEKSASRLDTNDARILGYLAYYKTLYEALAPRVLAAGIASLVVMGRLPADSFKLTDDGKVDLAALRDLPNHMSAVHRRLAIGLNNHLRNAYSHENYRLLDGGLIELWDTNPRTGARNWGPERWDLTQIRSLARELWLNCLAHYLSQQIFSVNNREILEAGDYFERYRPAPPRRRAADIDRIARLLAEERSFCVLECSASGQSISMSLQLKFPAVEQPEEVFVGYTIGAAKYLRPVSNVEVLVAEQCIGLLQVIENELDAPTEYSLKVYDVRKKLVGAIKTDSLFVKTIPKKDTAPFSQVRKGLAEDTTGESRMNVIMRFPLEPAP